jgi:F-type H+-transporting ATPase subunit b
VDAIGFNLPGLASQFINFVILLVLLRLFAYGPVVRMLDRRSQRIRESLEAAELARQESARSEEQVRQAIQEARQQGQQLIDQARQTGERMVADARDEARRQADEDTARARTAIERERDEAIEAVRRQFASLAITAAERVIHRSLDPVAHQDLIQEVLEEVIQSPDRS